MLTTMSVSVLNVPSFGRWSVPTRRMFRRSVPFHGGRVAAGAGVTPGAGVEREGPVDAALESPGLGAVVPAWSQLAWPVASKTQFTRSDAWTS